MHTRTVVGAGCSCHREAEAQAVHCKEAAGEHYATTHITHRPGPAQADGLRAVGKTHIMILQAEQQDKIGVRNHVLEQKDDM